MSHLPQKNITLKVINNEPRVSALVVSDSTGNKYTSINNLIRTYRKDIEEFGEISVDDLKSSTDSLGRSNKSKSVPMLNEQQATFLMTLLKNSKQVVEFKKNLVKAFFQLKEAQPASPSLFTKYDFTLVIFYLFGRAMRREATPNLKLSSIKELTTKYNESLFRRTALTEDEITTLVVEKLLDNGFLHFGEDPKLLTNYTYGEVLGALNLHSYGAEIQLIMNRPLDELPPVQNPTPLQAMITSTHTTLPTKSKSLPSSQKPVVYVEMVLDAIDMMKKHQLEAAAIKNLILEKQF